MMPFSKFACESSVLKIHRFQNLPATNLPFLCEQETYPSHFAPFLNCPGIVQMQSISLMCSEGRGILVICVAT